LEKSKTYVFFSLFSALGLNELGVPITDFIVAMTFPDNNNPPNGISNI